ncbi:polyphosphoinositide phosphatase isoform X2 [Phymastichus coffea]|uniref:polyphosphoinositide phosphatase isoform X2 n=1 Tax=Phymastichus coffea TaxID=108790 RepID=UPI00273A9C1D|nr:polyphosphoinositide phosphatase isoform X2 [Phymastichus coffea]
MDLSKVFHPIITSIQKIALYETKSHFYLMGSNNTLTRFRVLKIDRMEPKNLHVIDDKIEYTQDEIRDLVKMIDLGNRNKTNQKNNTSGVSKLVSAFGIIGFIRFLEGYYIILITKRRRVAAIGHHTIYKVEDSTMIYIPSDTIRHFHPDEQRYVKMFQSIDLSSNFYFSYSYDLTHTLQHNMIVTNYLQNKKISNSISSILKENENNHAQNSFDMSAFQAEVDENSAKQEYGIWNNPYRRFIWNSHLLSPVANELHRDWLVHIIHGFVGQSNVSVYGRSLYITIIARRSNKYAGTRFLKRGANFEGDVANEVETEQIVHDSSVSSLYSGHFSSFVQMRGSVPGHWSQDVSKMVPKPIITTDIYDPFVQAAGAHFNNLLERYGSPVFILNLVKKREKRKHESTLSEEISMAIKYLNQFLPLEHHIQYISFDMARKNKGKEANVMERLANIANNAVLKTGIFHSSNYSYKKSQIPYQKQGFGLQINSTSLVKEVQNINLSINYFNMDNVKKVNNEIQQLFSKQKTFQNGIIRTNCVDCLDRTNTAQFAIGKCALEYQLYSLGVLNSPLLEFDTDCVRLLEELYEDHGDTLALQYGGSQLVHRIKTYRKTAPWTSQGNDIMQTLSRYYSNTFSDQEKQHAMNLFLGLFIPEESKPPIWESVTDYYLHHSLASNYSRKSDMLTQWWSDKILEYLPYPFFDVKKVSLETIQMKNSKEEQIDIYYDYYRPYELTLLSETYAYQISHSVRDFMPHFTTNFSPFVVRIRPGKRREDSQSRNINFKNPSMTGQCSTSSTPSSASSSISSSDEEEENHSSIDHQILSQNSQEFTFEGLFPNMKEMYGCQLEHPKRNDVLLYKKFILIGKNSLYNMDHFKFFTKLFNQVYYFDISEFKIKDISSFSIYKQYLERAQVTKLVPNHNNMDSYERHVYQYHLNRRI